MSDLIIVRTLPAPTEQIWRRWTEPSLLAGWLWPARFETVVTTDPVVGGRFTIVSTPMAMAVSGRYEVVDRPTRLCFTWQWDGETDGTRVEVVLAEVGPDTELTVTHSGFASDDVRADHVQGWSDCLGRLAVAAAPD